MAEGELEPGAPGVRRDADQAVAGEGALAEGDAFVRTARACLRRHGQRACGEFGPRRLVGVRRQRKGVAARVDHTRRADVSRPAPHCKVTCADIEFGQRVL